MQGLAWIGLPGLLDQGYDGPEALGASGFGDEFLEIRLAEERPYVRRKVGAKGLLGLLERRLAPQPLAQRRERAERGFRLAYLPGMGITIKDSV